MALSALLVSAVIFVGLTRTEVGRNGIRQQIESAFNQRFAGSLTIDRLEGTLIDDFIATDVRLKDPSGRLVARVDSIVATPRWATLLTSTLSFRSVTLENPHLRLHRDSTGRWNAEDALQRRSTSPADSDRPLDFSFATISVNNGRVTTRRDGERPSLVQNDWLFDYTQTEVRDIRLDASVEWTEQDQLLDIEFGSMYLPEPDLKVSTFRGQAILEKDRWSLTRFDLTTSESRLRATGSIQPSSSDRRPPAFDLQIARSRIDHDELGRILPRLPLTDVVTLEGRVRGSLDRLFLNDLRLTHGESFARLDGSLSDLPTSLDAELTLVESHLLPSDLQEVWPDFPHSQFRPLGPIETTASITGTARWQNRSRPAVDLSGTVDAQSPEGAMQGRFSLNRTNSRLLQYSANLQVDSLNLDSLPSTPALATDLNGRLEVEGEGLTAQTLSSRFDVSLSASQLGPQHVASAQASFWVANQTAQGSVTLNQLLGGALHAEGSITALDETPSYQGTAEAENFNVAPYEDHITSTQLNALLTVEGQGIQWQSLSGRARLEVDSSTVRRANETVPLPPHSASLRLADTHSQEPRIEIDGSVASVTVDGTTLGPPLWKTGRVWLATLEGAVQRELEKPAPSLPADSSGALSPSFSLPFTEDSTALHSAAQASLARSGHTAPLEVSTTVDLLQPEVLHAWWPTFPSAATDLTAEAELLLSLDSLHSSGRMTTSSLQFGSRQMSEVEATYEVATPLRRPLAESVSGSLEVAAHEIQFGGPSLLNPKAALTYASREGRLQVEAERMGATRELGLISDLHIAPNRNELTIRDVSATIGSHEWTNPQPGTVLLHADGVLFSPLIIESPHTQLSSPQRLQLAGTVSSSATDSLSLEAQNVLLAPFSQVAELPKPIGGQLNGHVDLIGGWADPQLEGDLAVQRLSYDRRVLGDLNVQSRYTTDSPDLILEASLNTKAPNPDSLSGPSFVPGGPQSVEPNRLRMSGRIRLPSWVPTTLPAHTSELSSDEHFDLTVDVERADLFFFEYIFEEKVTNVQGFATGRLHIGGNLQYPIFDADLDVENGAVSLPEFGLNYRVSGPVAVDHQGIHLQSISVLDDDGSATVDGSILFNEYQFFSFDLRGELDGITVIDVPDAQDLPFYGHVRGSGPVTLTGPLSDASLRSESAETTADSELYIPASGQGVENASGFIIFADSTGQLPNLQEITRRDNILSDRPAGEPTFVDGLDIDLNILAPEGSTVNLVFDPLVGDVVTAVGSGRVQLQRQEGEFYVYGTFNATGGTYLFTAGEVFVRRFTLNEGTITWDGSPTNAQLDLNAEYETRASPRGLPSQSQFTGRIPVTIDLGITGRVESPNVDLSLSLSREERGEIVGSQTLDAILNQPDQATEYATSVLLTNTFLLTTESFLETNDAEPGGPSENLRRAGYNSVSQLVASQLNRYLAAALPNVVDVNFGLQGEDPKDLDVIYGIALRLLNERLVIRGEGVYTADNPEDRQTRGPEGEFVVEVRLSSRVSAEVFYRRTGDNLTFNQIVTSSAGAGLSYQTEFSTWHDLFTRVFGWLLPDSPPEDSPDPDTEPVTRRSEEPDSTGDESNDAPQE